eukprot:922070_1
MTMPSQCINERQELLDGPPDINNGNDTASDSTDTGTDERKEVLDSWEDADNDQRMTSSRRNRNLKRLELRNFHPPTAEGAIDVLTRCPSLTHLSLGNSLNAQTGPSVLLWDLDSHSNSNSFTSDADVDANVNAGFETSPD